MTGCDYVLHVGTTTPAGNKEGTYGVTADIVCPPEKHIDVVIYSDYPTHSSVVCKLTVTAQTGLSGPHVTNTAGKEDFDINGVFTNIHVHREGLCLLDGKGKTTLAGKFSIDATVKAHNELGVAEGVTITE
jgi:hypothetical protein